MAKRQQASKERGAYEVHMEENPLMTYAQFVHEATSGTRHPGKSPVLKNLRTLMGGYYMFAASKGPLSPIVDSEEKAAIKFKSMCEAAQVGSIRAVDTTNEPVDGGGINPEAAIEIGAMARKESNEIYALLGRIDFRAFQFVVVGEKGPTAYARFKTGNVRPNARIVSRAKVEIRRIAQKLAVHWNLSPSEAGRGGRPSGWCDDSEMVFTGIVSSRRAG